MLTDTPRIIAVTTKIISNVHSYRTFISPYDTPFIIAIIVMIAAISHHSLARIGTVALHDNMRHYFSNSIFRVRWNWFATIRKIYTLLATRNPAVLRPSHNAR